MGNASRHKLEQGFLKHLGDIGVRGMLVNYRGDTRSSPGAALPF